MTHVHILRIFSQKRFATHALLSLQIGRDTKVRATDMVVTVDGHTHIKFGVIDSPSEIDRLRGYRWDIVEIDYDSYHRTGKADLHAQIIHAMAYMLK